MKVYDPTAANRSQEHIKSSAQSQQVVPAIRIIIGGGSERVEGKQIVNTSSGGVDESKLAVNRDTGLGCDDEILRRGLLIAGPTQPEERGWK